MNSLELAVLDERVLLVEDDPSMRDAVVLGLERAGFRVMAEADGKRGLGAFRRTHEPFDLVLLDLMLPSLDGLELCREIRKTSAVPVLVVTARTGTDDAVIGLEAGADDYIRKPFQIPELLARIRAVLRRARDRHSIDVWLPGLEIDLDTFRVRKNGREILLTATEFRLLTELARRPGQVFTREMLLEQVWGRTYLGDSRLVDMAVKRLRDKLEDDPHNPALITTVRGAGYRAEPA